MNNRTSVATQPYGGQLLHFLAHSVGKQNILVYGERIELTLSKRRSKMRSVRKYIFLGRKACIFGHCCTQWKVQVFGHFYYMDKGVHSSAGQSHNFERRVFATGEHHRVESKRSRS